MFIFWFREGHFIFNKGHSRNHKGHTFDVSFGKERDAITFRKDAAALQRDAFSTKTRAKMRKDTL